MLHFIVNKSSRSGKAAEIWRETMNYLDSRKIPYERKFTQYEGHATILARELSMLEEEDICIVALGGDGTMNEVINGITDFNKVRFGMIPVGSGNDFGHGLGLADSPVDNLKIIIEQAQLGKNHFEYIDLGQVSWNNGEDTRYYGISAGVGLDAQVCKLALNSKLKKFLNAIHLGKLTYKILTIYTLFSMDTAEAKVIYMNNGEETTTTMKKLIFSAAMNLRAEGGGVPMAPRAKATNHVLMMSSAFGIPKWRTFFCLPLLIAGKHEKIKGFSITEFEQAMMHVSKPMVLHADGEYLADVTDATFSCMKSKLKLLNKVNLK